LDMPAVAMTAFALAVLFWWRSYENPSAVRTVLCGLALGAGCMTKQLVVAYLLPALLYFLVKDFAHVISRKEQSDAPKYGTSLIHTLSVLMVALLASLPFAAVSYGVHSGWLNANVEAFARVGVHHSFIGNLCYFLGLLPSEMSPALLCIFLMSLLFFRGSEYRRLVLIIVSALGGLFFSCTSMGTDLEERYLLPLLISPAFFSV